MTKRDVFQSLSTRMAVSGLRQNNERAVMTSVAMGDGLSAAEVARATGLGAQTVARIVNELESQHLLYRGEPRRGQRGQPAVPIYVDPDGAYSIGCEIGWRSLHMLIRNMGGQILLEHHIDYPYPDSAFLMAEVVDRTRAMVDLVPEAHRDRIVGLGIASPSNIGRNADLLGTPLEVTQVWRELDIADHLERETGLSVSVLNDGNAACWAELAARPVPRPSNMAYFIISTFVGAGLIAQGSLWEGPSGNSANLGSMLVTDRNGQQTFVHLIASIFAFEQRLRDAGLAVPPGNPAEWDWNALEPVTTDWINDSARAIAKTITNTMAVMEFSLAVVDGIMPRAITERLASQVQFYSDQQPVLTSDRAVVKVGLRGALAPAMGAALRLLYRRFYSRDPADLLDTDSGKAG
ncbi:ROK family transcriptional regulator [Devosia sp. FKR38]|uniref:ROK family transcriptional regulator n=1 Tax=Devosia sp. FKR38 TaxID=2562312 RepID=UPI0014858F22|nr:ROK family transcriptional regulator [Devosia sp. FKR38]